MEEVYLRKRYYPVLCFLQTLNFCFRFSGRNGFKRYEFKRPIFPFRYDLKGHALRSEFVVNDWKKKSYTFYEDC
jgi:hypothetical protein